MFDLRVSELSKLLCCLVSYKSYRQNPHPLQVAGSAAGSAIILTFKHIFLDGIRIKKLKLRQAARSSWLTSTRTGRPAQFSSWSSSHSWILQQSHE